MNFPIQFLNFANLTIQEPLFYFAVHNFNCSTARLVKRQNSKLIYSSSILLLSSPSCYSDKLPNCPVIDRVLSGKVNVRLGIGVPQGFVLGQLLCCTMKYT